MQFHLETKSLLLTLYQRYYFGALDFYKFNVTAKTKVVYFTAWHVITQYIHYLQCINYFLKFFNYLSKLRQDYFSGNPSFFESK